MKTPMRRISILTLIALFCLPMLAIGQNLLTNGDFESWVTNGPGGPPDNWYFYWISTDYSAAQEPVTVYEGNYSLKLEWSNTSPTCFMHDSTIPGESGKTYTLEYRLLDNDSGVEVRPCIYYSGGDHDGEYIVGDFSADSSDWQLISYTFIATTDAFDGFRVSIQLNDVSGWTPPGVVYVDQVSFYEETGANQPPEITSVEFSPSVVFPSDNIIVNATITDDGTIADDMLNYGFVEGYMPNSIDHDSISGDNYFYTIPAFPAGTNVYFEIYAIDDEDVSVTSTDTLHYFVVEDSAASPVIMSVGYSPTATIFPTDVVEVTAVIKDNSAVTGDSLFYSHYSGGPYSAIEHSGVSSSGDTCWYTIPAFEAGTEVYFYIYAVDDESNTKVSSTMSYTVVEQGRNLLRNSNFESWVSNGADGPPDDWYFNYSNDGYSATPESVVVYEGTYSTKVEWISGITSKLSQIRGVPGENGVTYTLEYYILDNDPDVQTRPHVYYMYQGSNVGYVRGSYTEDSDDWQLVTMTFTADNTSFDSFLISIELKDVSGWTPPGVVYVDKMSFSEANEAPVIDSIEFTPATVYPTDGVYVSAIIIDDDTITGDSLYYAISSVGTYNAIAHDSISGDYYWYTIPAQVAGEEVSFYVFAIDDLDVSSTSNTYQYTVAYPTGACCVDDSCTATNTETECAGLGGNWYEGETCPEYECVVYYQYLPGDANMAAGSWPPNVIGADVTYLVNYFRAIAAPCLLDGFYTSGDANGDCSVIGADVTYLVQYFRGANELHFCPDYEPSWSGSGDLPAEAPDGWPNCD